MEPRHFTMAREAPRGVVPIPESGINLKDWP